MKYLSIYEKFDSPIISKTISFLSKKISKFQSNRFIQNLKEKLENIDFPISKLEDSDIMYLKKDKALEIKKDNPTDLDYLKFWFSIESGYLFTTGTGALTLINRDDNINIITDNDILKNIKRSVPTGIARPVTDYSEIKHLDKVVGVFSSGQYDKFIVATIWIEGRMMYAIQNEKDGGSPSNTREWRSYGRYSWSLGYIGDISDDHHFLHFYEENDEPLKIINPGSNKEINVYDYNLLYEYGGKLNNKSSMENELKKADFALVISVQDLLDKNYNLKDIAKSRIESRTGATYLMDDEMIKKINIERYTKQLFSKFGINKEGLNLDNLEKIITKLILKDLAFYYIVSNDVNTILTISNKIKNLMAKDISSYHIDYYVTELYSIYKNINSYFSKKYNVYKKNIDFIKKYTKENNITYMTEIMEIFDDITIKIYNSVNEDKINNIHDLLSCYYKLDTIRKMFSNYIDENKLKSLFGYYLHYDNEYNSVSHFLDNISNEAYEQAIIGIKAIQKHVKKTF